MSDFYYLGSPYSKYPTGLDDAFRIICYQAALLIKAGVPIFCPISHTHYIAQYGNIDGRKHELWSAVNKPFLERAFGLIVVKMHDWELSKGLAEEIQAFTDDHRPIYYMTPGFVPPELFGPDGNS